jgi:hypothetical protein
VGSTELTGLELVDEVEGWGMGRLCTLEVNSVKKALSPGRPAVAELFRCHEHHYELENVGDFASRRQLDSLLQSLLHIRSFDLQIHTPIRPLIPVYIDFLACRSVLKRDRCLERRFEV